MFKIAGLALLTGAALFVSFPGQAAASSQEKTAEESGAQTTAVYRIYNHGLHVVDAVADYKLTEWGYGIRTTLHAGGLMSWFLRMDVQSSAEGRFEHNWVQPIAYRSSGFSRGKHRTVVLNYANATPHIVILDPKESDREAVSQADLYHAMDTLSAMALLLGSVRRAETCEGSAHVFDGLRLSLMTAHGPFKSEVPTSFSQKFKGSALRCDFVGRQEAGFIKNSSHLDVMKAPHQGAAWFQEIPGIGLTAIRIEFEHPKLGRMIAVLDRASTLSP